MKYFAILKDSLKEALDSKVLYVLLGLSTLVIGVVAMLSFKPLSVEKTMQQFMPRVWGPSPIQAALNERKQEKLHNQGMMRMQPNENEFHLVDVKLLRGAENAPDSDYELTISMTKHRHGMAAPMPVPIDGKGKDGKNVEEANIPKEDPQVALQAIRKIFADAEALGFTRIGEITQVIPEKKGEEDGKREFAPPKIFKVTFHGTPTTYRIWASEPSFLAFPMEGISQPLGYSVYNVSKFVLAIGSWVAILTGVVITSFFIPNMLRKGTVDLLLVKPIHRWALLTYKYIGGLTFIFLSTAYAVGGVWLVLGIRTGLWANGALLLIFTLTFFFAILYAVSTFIGVVTRSTVTAIMLTVAAWFVFFLIGFVYDKFELVSRVEKVMADANQPIPEDQRWGDGKIALTVRILHAISPRTEDLNNLNDLIVYTSFMTGNIADAGKFDTSNIVWWESLLVSGVWIGLFLGLAALWFTLKDY